MSTGATTGGPEGDRGLSDVLSERGRLVGLAYRLLGSVTDAEDAVQEAFARWFTLTPKQRAGVDSPGAWLSTVTGRICLDVLGSARARRERYTGPWLPEPLPGTPLNASSSEVSGDPADRVTLDESVTMAFLVALESMTPAERVSLILHDVFGYSFAEVAGIVGRTPAACRQLASSARHRSRAAGSDGAPPAGHAETIRLFKRAWEAGDIEALLGLLDPSATAIADGGGLTRAVLEPIVGAERIVDHYLEIARKMPPSTSLELESVNGRPGLVMREGGAVRTVFSFEVSAGRITRIWAVRNPEKLRRW